MATEQQRARRTVTRLLARGHWIRRTRLSAEEPLVEGVPLAGLVRSRLIPSPDAVMLSRPGSCHAERFRQLRRVLVDREGDRAQVVVVTGPGTGEGTSTAALNLALAFAAGEEGATLLIDGDLRCPSLAARLIPRPKIGLVEVLTGRIVAEHAVVRSAGGPLRLLPAGGAARDPFGLLSSAAARRLFTGLRRRYRRIIVDAPPVVPHPDANALGSVADGAILVVRAGATSVLGLERAQASLDTTPLLGIVLNEHAFNLADWNRGGGGPGRRRHGAR